MPMSTTGLILHLQRLSTEDGPGIRTTVFFKGCPLRCQWCHNPESLAGRAQAQWLENRCIGCDSCLAACPQHALRRTTQGIERNRAVCTACGACVEACPSNAMELLGRVVDADELVVELLKDRAFFDKSGGGVTLSGGEPAFQPDFAAALLQKLRAAGVHTALDTCGLCSRPVLERLLPLADLILFDLKLADAAEHERWTGANNRAILENLRYVGQALRSSPPQALWVRTPLAPGATTTEQNIRAIGAVLADSLDGVLQRWELCAFNNLCRDKYRRLDLEWAFAGVPLMTRAELAQAESWAKDSGVDPHIVSITGSARVES